MIRPFLLLFSVLALAPSTPDEGQWLPQQVLAMDWEQLRARGMKLTKDEFWHPEKGGVLSAAVQINGCSASFVSADGLLVTNHHCGFGAIQRLSTVEQNHLRDGFTATTRAQELPARGMVVQVVRKIENITDKVHAAQERASSDLERYMATQRVIAELIAEGEKVPDTTCSVASFLEGKEYHLYHRTRLTDVRLVYAPPRAVGEFGGEVDNWEWPRHTGDFSFFRAYAAPDGSPRGYDEANVPYRPDHYLKVSPDGVQADDLVMILGYPGSTERYRTGFAVSERQSFYYPKRLELFTAMIDILEAASEESEAAALQWSSLIKSLANVQKNAQGMIEGLARNGVVAGKRREEQALQHWIEQSTERQERYGDVLEQMIALDRDEAETQHKDMVLGLALSGTLSPTLRALVDATTLVASGRGGEAVERRLRADITGGSWETVGKPMLGLFLEEMRALPDDQRIAGAEAVLGVADTVGSDEFLAGVLERTKMLDADARVALFAEGGAEAIRSSDDPLVVLARALTVERAQLVRRNQERDGRRLVVGRRWIEAQEQWRGRAFYPDANSTLRVSIATVKGYEPRDGVYHVPHTTVAGVLAKETGVEPFANPQALLDAAADRRESRFFDEKIGDVPVCFLADGDTTGGNSGSCVIDGQGRLVGLNFDRVFENVAGDYGWRPERSRNISVDVRYLLWFMDQVQPAPELLEEMGL